MKKIVLATGIFPPDIGGPATYSKLLLDNLPQKGFEVQILAYGNASQKQNGKVFIVSKKLPRGLKHFIYFVKVIWLGRKADIIFAQDPVSVGLPAMLAAKILGKKFIIKIVGDYAWEQGFQRFGVKDLLDDFQNKKYNFFVEILRFIQRNVCGGADQVITPSFYLKKIVLGWGVKKDKIKVIYNAYILPMSLRFWSDRTGLREKRSKGLDGRVIVSAGRLVPWKGFDMLIKIMPDLLIKFPDLRLVIIGDGPDREKLEHKTNNLGLAKNVRFTGNLSHSEVMEYLVASDVFVLNTAYEGFSHQLLEAMAIGKPVITTDVGGNPELTKGGELVFIVKFNDERELKDKITDIFGGSYNVIADGQSFSMVGNSVKKHIENARINAQKISQEFPLKRMIGELKEVLEDIL